MSQDTTNIISNLLKLKDYVPLFQTIIWIIFIFIICLIFKKSIYGIITILQDRIKKGSSVKVGSIEIGEELKNITYEEQVEHSSKVLIGADGGKRESHRIEIYKKNKGLFLTHLIYPSVKSVQLFQVYIYLIRHKLDDFSDIEKAEFFFGHMWSNRVFTEKPKNGIVGISTSAYAPFLCTCCVKFKNGEEIQLDRYIDFEISKIYEKIK